MRTCSIFISASVAFIGFFIFGCAKMPDKELNAAMAALDSARAVQADNYAAGDFKTAKGTIDEAIIEIHKKNYEKAKMMLVSAMAVANNAKMNAVEGKKQAAAEANSALMRANTLLTDVKSLIKKAPKGKHGITTLKSEAAAVEVSLKDAQSAKNNGDFISANNEANACLAKLVAIKSTFGAATAKTPAKVTR
jgi:hypothetical protein